MKPQRLTPDQIAWLQERSPGFRMAHEATIRRDAEVAANREAMKGNCTETGANGTALSPRPPLRLHPDWARMVACKSGSAG